MKLLNNSIAGTRGGLPRRHVANLRRVFETFENMKRIEIEKMNCTTARYARAVGAYLSAGQFLVDEIDATRFQVRFALGFWFFRVCFILWSEPL